jgi:hypothetical protein
MYSNCSWHTDLEFLNNLWGLGTEQEQGYRTGPLGYIGWRNSFFGIYSRSPETFKNTGSESGAVCTESYNLPLFTEVNDTADKTLACLHLKAKENVMNVNSNSIGSQKTRKI